MWKSSKKTGATLIEILCALHIIALFFMIIVSIQLNTLSLRRQSKILMEYSALLEAVKTEAASNLTYNDLMQLSSENKVYLKGDKLNFNVLKNNNIKDLFSDELPENETYLRISIASGTVLKVRLELQINVESKIESIASEFYKGNYL